MTLHYSVPGQYDDTVADYVGTILYSGLYNIAYMIRFRI